MTWKSPWKQGVCEQAIWMNCSHLDSPVFAQFQDPCLGRILSEPFASFKLENLRSHRSSKGLFVVGNDTPLQGIRVANFVIALEKPSRSSNNDALP